MSNPSKQKGTAAETAVVNAALDAGIVAHRVALAGIHDKGDVWLANGRAVIECKAGNMAHNASRNQIDAWWQEAEAEAARVAQANVTILVVKARGKGQARDWRAFTSVSDYAWAAGLDPVDSRIALDRLVEMPLGHLLDDLRGAL